jgi:hypothetical protein
MLSSEDRQLRCSINATGVESPKGPPAPDWQLSLRMISNELQLDKRIGIYQVLSTMAGTEYNREPSLNFWARPTNSVIYTLDIEALRTLGFAAGFVAQPILVPAIFGIT